MLTYLLSRVGGTKEPIKLCDFASCLNYLTFLWEEVMDWLDEDTTIESDGSLYWRDEQEFMKKCDYLREHADDLNYAHDGPCEQCPGCLDSSLKRDLFFRDPSEMRPGYVRPAA